MTTRNPPHSVKDRLMNLARRESLDYNRVQLLYAQERFLARLAASPHRDRLVLKGGLYLYARYGVTTRPTRDVDFLGRATPAEVDVVAALVRDVAAVPLEDGLDFDAASITAASIKEGADYEGVRVRLVARLGKARQPLQLDVGFGDVVHPSPSTIAFPTLLGGERPAVIAYPLESVIAEKFQAAVELGELNTRLKDFHDLYRVSLTEPLAADALARAVRRTFERRGTALADAAAVLEPAFAADPARSQQWAAYRRGAGRDAPEAFDEVMARVQALLAPIAGGSAEGWWSPVEVVWRR